jgi:peptidoglycan/xylan/chitin deacetylase (PgdA/CDA1 family)
VSAVFLKWTPRVVILIVTDMRPPYLSTSATALSALKTLGYYVISVDIDTLDWQYNTASTIQTAVTNYKKGLDAGGSISLSHDPEYEHPLPNGVKQNKTNSIAQIHDCVHSGSRND